MGVNAVYITTPEQLDEALIEINDYIDDPYWKEKGKKATLGLDLETYHLSDLKEEELPEEFEEEIEDDSEDEEETVKGKKKERLVPRPILQADGTYSGQIRLIQIGLDPRYAPKTPNKNIQFVIDVKLLGYEILKEKLQFLTRC
jgi:hypothetical protein